MTIVLRLIFVVLLGALALSVSAISANYLIDHHIFDEEQRALVQAFVMSGLLVPTVMFLRKVVDKKTLSSMGMRLPLVATYNFLFGLLPVLLPLVVVILLSNSLGWSEVRIDMKADRLLPLLTGAFVALLFEALPEEIAYRGYVFSTLNERLSKLGAGLITTALFTLSPIIFYFLHKSLFMLDPTLGGAGSIHPSYLITLVIFGLFVMYLRILNETIWAPMGFHMAFVYVDRIIGPNRTDFVQFSEIKNTGAMLAAGGSVFFCTLILMVALPWLRGRPIGWRKID